MRTNGGENCRGLEFEFGDCDSLLVELEEQYSYAESRDINLNRVAANELANEIGHQIGSEPFCRRALAHLEIRKVKKKVTKKIFWVAFFERHSNFKKRTTPMILKMQQNFFSSDREGNLPLFV